MMISTVLHVLLGTVFFGGIFRFFQRFMHCPSFLVPLCSTTSVISLLMLGGLAGVLYPAMILIFILGFLGCAGEIYLLKKGKSGKLCEIPLSWSIFFFFAAIFFAYSFGCMLGGCDTIHHWAITQKGIMDYDGILDLPTEYRNYPVGMGVWGYFVNHLFYGSVFRQESCLFACLLLYLAAFSAMWGLFQNKRIVLKNILYTCIFLVLLIKGTERMWNYSNSASFVWWTLAIIVLGIVSSYEVSRKQGVIDALKTVFLMLGTVFCVQSCRITMFVVLSDLLFPFLAGMALFAYLSHPRLKSLVWITPVLCALFCIKRPGLFLAIAVYSICLLDYIITHHFWRFFKYSSILESTEF